ncbi:hypothetical protein NA57DRAFT_36523 [Rhizodiscina lignyota]|uniref:RNA binding protein Jsn1 n=1 Tax=Rhizodiscina lignyota TaxID=1504668 RepID=A0A9P4III6_9PEZI|nr:hypothetical protein NA57DRAFT_36523 [Rhizodiscina lignyota]
MGPSSRPEHNINLSYLPQLGPSPTLPRSGSSTAATSPIEPPSGNSIKSPFGNLPTMNANSTASTRINAGSPSHEFGGGGRLYSKRAREIQAQEGLSPQVWGPPTSGNSTPLRETIPESPTGDSFPDFNQGAPVETGAIPSSGRRARAGTLPSRFSPTTGLNQLNVPSSLLPKTSRPTPSTSPFKPGSHTPTEAPGFPPSSSTAAAANSALLSRLRAGSMPQQRATLIPQANNPFGSSLFSSAWSSSRDRSNTLASIRSSDGPSSPAQSSFSRDSLADGDVKTLDYLGLVDTPQQSRATLAPSTVEMLLESQRNANIADMVALKNANRFRSYSVNAKEKYADDEDAGMGQMPGGYGNYSGSITPSAETSAHSYAAIQEAVRQHNLDVQAFANFASVSRPRARTAGVLESPSTRLMRSYMPSSSRLDSSMTAGDLAEEAEYSGLTEAVQGLQLGGATKGEGSGDEHNAESPTRALWLGNIPSSTTVSSLNVIFGNFGTIESTRVLTHKNCGFVNFENLDSAIRARSQLNGKEIFPGAGPIRIGYAKVPSASGTPGNNGLYPSPSPDPTAKATQGEGEAQASENALGQSSSSPVEPSSALPQTPALIDIQGEIVEIVKELGATDEEQMRIAQTVELAVQYNSYASEIPSVPEPNHNRMHDAPRLRDIRKRIDNNTCTAAEIEDVAMSMLPEIAELSSDYLGNTVVQKLFEYCSEEVKEAMLNEIAPHLAEIGVHKNGTWAAQKIIDVARTPALMSMVVESLRPYSVALFLDQFGNYVMQGCLRYQFPLNNFIFDTMLCNLWDLAQGRFGARAMRACLESHYATKDQQRMIAATIALHSVQLATNANGALLLTWFLDTCTFPRRRSVLAPRLVPHLVHLCTHKVAYLTVLKIINQRNEPEARDAILQALFFSEGDKVLTEILSDQACGATLIFKVLTTPFFDEKIRNDVVTNVRNVLLKIKAQPQQGYKRLMDEVGLSTRIGGHGNMNGPLPQPHLDTSMNRPFYPMGPSSAGGFDPATGLQRTNSMDSGSTFDNYPLNVNVNMNGMNNVPSPMTYTPSPTAGPGMGMPMPGMTPQQMQYQQAMMAQNGRQNFYPPLNVNVNGMNGFGSGYGAPGFSPMMAGQMPGQMPGQQMWSPQQYGMGGGYMGMQPQAQQAGGMRRGRVSVSLHRKFELQLTMCSAKS